jgi:hypothetical protein
MSDNRFLPAGVRRSPFFLLRVARLGTALVVAADCGEWPSSAAMARFSRSLSRFNSATIVPVSKVLSFGLGKIVSLLPSIPDTKGSTSSHERSGLAIADLKHLLGEALERLVSHGQGNDCKSCSDSVFLMPLGLQSCSRSTRFGYTWYDVDFLRVGSLVI